MFVCAERDYRAPYLIRAMSQLPYEPVNGLALTALESERLIDLYERFGLLGHSAVSQNRTRFSREIASDPIAVATCRILTRIPPMNH